MNGHFEIERSAYPIGPLRAGGDFKVHDMRNLQALHSHAITSQQASDIAAKANARIRAGSLSLKDGDTSIAEFVKAEVAAL